MHITLFGGSFNPSHIGHQIVLAQAFDLIPPLSANRRIDQIWLLPDYHHAFDKNQNLAPAKHRLAMTKLLENHKIKTNTCTFDQKMPGNTIFHINYLKKTHPKHQFSFLMGSDNLKTFHKWPEYKKLLKLMPFYIYPRAGFPFKPLYQNMTPLTHPLQVITNISSTKVRNRLQKGLTVKHLIPLKVSEYIEKHQLYQP